MLVPWHWSRSFWRRHSFQLILKKAPILAGNSSFIPAIHLDDDFVGLAFAPVIYQTIQNGVRVMWLK